jgi:hypothetical protein
MSPSAARTDQRHDNRRNNTGTTREDELLARAYQQAIGAQAEQYSVGYDISGGLERFTNWLRDHAVADLEC